MNKILIVDDEELIRESLSDFLVDNDFYVALAETGAKGISELSSDIYKVAIVDMSLPDMNGENFIKQAFKISPDIIPIIHTGDTTYSISEELLNLGMKKYAVITKPVLDMMSIIQMINSLCNEE